jgi:DNA-directed RNA polymerase specialized sigma24 family protein
MLVREIEGLWLAYRQTWVGMLIRKGYDKDRAEDAVQDGMLWAIENSLKLDYDKNPKSYLSQFIKGVAKDTKNRESQESTACSLDDLVLADEPSTTPEYNTALDRDKATKAFLTNEEQAFLACLVDNDYNVRAAAKEYGIPVTTARHKWEVLRYLLQKALAVYQA